MIIFRFINSETGQQILDTLEWGLEYPVQGLLNYCARMGYDAEILSVRGVYEREGLSAEPESILAA